MTMIVMLNGRSRPHFEIPMVIFQNDSCSHTIYCVRNNVPGLCYRSGPKVCMYTRLFETWLNEKQVISAFPAGNERVLFVDNASGHKKNAAEISALHRSFTKLVFLRKNSTDLF